MTLSSPSPATPQKNRLWVVWLLYFFQFVAVGVYFVYLNIYYRQAGLSGTQIGVMNMTGAIIGVASAVIWGYVSDRTGKPRLLIAFGAAGALIVAQFIPLVHTFWAYFALTCLGSSLSSSLGTLVDGVTLSLLGSSSENYGRYRLGGSIGFIVATSTAGFVFDRTGLGLIFPAYGLTMFLFAATALLLPAIPVRTEARPRGEIGQMIRRPEWLYFAGCVFLVWVGIYASITFLGVTLQSMGANQSLIGIALTIGAVVELPFMAFSGWFIKRFGAVRLMFFAMALMTIRHFLLGMMGAPFWAIPINILNGPAYVFFANSSVAYANRLAPQSLKSTSQGLLNSTISLAGVVSSLLAGILFDRLGGGGIFTVMAFCCLAAMIVFGMGAMSRRQPAQEPL